MTVVNEQTGEEVSSAVVQDWLMQTQQRCGRIILGSELPVEVGQVQDFGGLPFRVVRLSSYHEAMKDAGLTTDMWGHEPSGTEDNYYFEVEVAD